MGLTVRLSERTSGGIARSASRRAVAGGQRCASTEQTSFSVEDANSCAAGSFMVYGAERFALGGTEVGTLTAILVGGQAVMNHIPPNPPVENALYYNQVYEELCWR